MQGEPCKGILYHDASICDSEECESYIAQKIVEKEA